MDDSWGYPSIWRCVWPVGCRTLSYKLWNVQQNNCWPPFIVNREGMLRPWVHVARVCPGNTGWEPTPYNSWETMLKGLRCSSFVSWFALQNSWPSARVCYLTSTHLPRFHNKSVGQWCFPDWITIIPKMVVASVSQLHPHLFDLFDGWKHIILYNVQMMSQFLWRKLAYVAAWDGWLHAHVCKNNIISQVLLMKINVWLFKS